MRFVLLHLALVTATAAAPQEFVSGSTRTHLVELFTSEGCSSCPPAEAWLAQLRHQPGLWRDFVPVAWHVDYWDRLGWKDRLASPANTQRHYAYASAWRSDSVYTPCLALDGREWRDRSVPPGSREHAGVLRASYEAARLTVTFAGSRPGPYEAHAVMLALGIASKVTRGENRGRELQHEFVAVSPPQSATMQDNSTAQIALPLPALTGVASYALAVWITRAGELMPLQTTGGMLNSASAQAR